MPGKIKRYLFISLLTIVVLTASVGLGLIPVNLFFAKASISEAFMDKLGAELEIHGSLWIRLGPRPTLGASEITLSQPGLTDRPLVQIDSLTIGPRLRDVLGGDIHLSNLNASGVVFDYCQTLAPSQNRGSTGNEQPSIAVDDLRISNIKPRCKWTGHQIAGLPRQFDLTASLPRDRPLEVEIRSRDDDKAMLLNVSGASLASLLGNSLAYPVDLSLSAFGSELRVSGTVGHPLSKPVLDVRVEVDSPHPSALLGKLDVEIPDLGVLDVDMDVQADADKIRVDRLEASLGGNQIAITGFVQNFSSKPYFEIDAQLDYLDFEQLLVDQDQTNGESDFEEINLQPWFNLLAQFDGKAQVKIDKLLNAPYQIDKLSIDTGMDDGVLSIKHSEVLLAGSLVTLVAELDTRLECPRLTSDVQVSNFDSTRLDTVLVAGSAFRSRFAQASVQSSSCGNTLKEHLDTFHSRFKISNAYLHRENENITMHVRLAEAEFAWNQPGQLSVDTEVLGEIVSTEIRFGPLGEMFNEKSWPLHFHANGTEAMLDLSGTATIRNGSMKLDGKLALDIAHAGKLLAWFDGDPDNQLIFSGTTGINFTDSGLSLNHIEARLGSSDLRGNINWDRSGNNSPIMADLQSDNLNMEELVSLFPGSVEPTPVQDSPSEAVASDLDLIDAWIGFPAINLDLKAANIDGLDFNITQVDLHANLRDRLIEEGRLSMQFEDHSVEGAVALDFREKPWSINSQLGADKVDVGELLAALELANDVDAQVGRLDFSYQSEGHSMAHLIENARIEANMESFRWIVATGMEDRTYTFDLSELNIAATPSSSIDWRSQGFLNGVPINVWMKTPPLPVTLDSNADLPLSLVMGFGNDVMMLQSVINRKVRDGFKADISISGQYMDVQSANFPELKSPLGDYEIQSSVLTRDGTAIFSKLEARIGTSSATGSVEIHREDNGHRFDIHLSSPFLETADLVQWLEDFRTSRQRISGENSNDTVNPESVAEVITLVTHELDEITGVDSYDVTLDIEELRSDGALLGKAQIGLQMDDKDFHLHPMQIKLEDRGVEAEYYSHYVVGGIESGLNIQIQGLEYGGLMRLLKPESQADGQLYLDAELISKSSDAASVLNNLQGHMDLLIFPDDIEAGFLDFWASNLIFALLKTGADSSKKLNCLVAQFDVEDGVMKTKKSFLDSTEIIVRIRGTIDLIARQLDLLAAPQAKLEKFLSVSTPIAVKGPFDNIKARTTVGGLAMTMVRWYYGLIYVPWKWLTGESFPADGIETCLNAFDLEVVEATR
jgi:uncharacterized protein involved in outer membrane biogenesis